jgi:hypothetical protein
MALNEVTTQCDTTNTHCTIAHHWINNLTKQVANKAQSKCQKSKKTAARFLTLPELCEEFELKDAEDQAKEKAELEKAAQKRADKRTYMLHINKDIQSQVFDYPLTSYK